MDLTARALNRATLARQLLLGRESLDVAQAMRRVVALQAQSPASPYLALLSRLDGFDGSALDAAFAGGAVVKATLMRITLHAVAAVDHPAMHAAMQRTVRSARLGDPRFADSGLSPVDADALVPAVLRFLEVPRRNDEVEAWLESELGVPGKPVWWAMRYYAPVVHAVTGGPWSFGQRPSYATAATAAAHPGVTPVEKALPTVVRRYLEGFGPASMADLAQFALLHRPLVRAAFAALADELEVVTGPDGRELYDVPGGLRPEEDSPAPPRLLPMWDSVLLAYADRSRVIPPDYRKAVTRSNGDVLPTLLVDGYVAGVWRPVEAGIEATAFHPLPAAAWEGLELEAKRLLVFLAEREPSVYSRFRNWWAKLPAGEVRVLGQG